MYILLSSETKPNVFFVNNDALHFRQLSPKAFVLMESYPALEDFVIPKVYNIAYFFDSFA